MAALERVPQGSAERDFNPQSIPPQNLEQAHNFQSIEFTRVKPLPEIKIKTGITEEHIKQIALWEKNVWGEQGRPFSNAVGQFKQELAEEEEIWDSVLADKGKLSDAETIHKLREEIGDGLIANVGVLRRIAEDDKAAVVFYTAVLENQEQSTKDSSLFQKMKTYNDEGHKLSDRFQEITDEMVKNLSSGEREEAINSIRNVIRAGLECMSELGADPDRVVGDKIALMSIKYNPNILRRGAEGMDPQEAMSRRKKAWNEKQLPVLNAKEIVVFQAA